MLLLLLAVLTSQLENRVLLGLLERRVLVLFGRPFLIAVVLVLIVRAAIVNLILLAKF